MTATPRPTGIVLGGAAALGAYEVGVVSHLVETLPREVGATIPSVITGTSAGAINAVALAAFADDPARGAQLLVRAWSELQLGQVLRPSSIELLSMVLDVAGLAGASARVQRALRIRSVRGGLLDPAPIARLVAQAPIARIGAHLAAGRLRGVAVSATRVSTGAAVVFHQARSLAGPWPGESNVVPVATTLTAAHVLASAAIPLLFPSVAIDGFAHCDGGLRQMVPLSPVIHMGCDRLLAVNPLRGVRPDEVPGVTPAVTSPLYLTGKALNALFADRLAVDVARLNQTTRVLRAGQRRFGPSFTRELNRELLADGQAELRPIEALCIEPSQDLGVLAAEHISKRAFAARVSGPAGRVLRWIAGGDPHRTADLLGYVLFDGAFMQTLIDLGRADARAHHDALCALFAPGDGGASRADTAR